MVNSPYQALNTVATDGFKREYFSRIHRAQDFIEDNLGRVLTLEEIARAACFSPYHFHRIFSAMVGESVAAYVRRLLLERAAMQLGHSPESVTQIALGAGYDSVDAFTRAFRGHMGMLPSEYRRRQGHLEAARRRTVARPLFYHEMPQCPPMNVQIKRFSPTLVAAVRHTGPYEESGPAWERLCGALAAGGMLSGASVAYGVSYDNPDITSPQKCRMDACVSLPPHLTEDSPELSSLLQHDEIILRHVGANQEYAVLLVRGSYALLHPAYRSLFGLWFPQSGREPFNDPGFEVYLNSPHTTPEDDLLTEICIPLKARIA